MSAEPETYQYDEGKTPPWWWVKQRIARLYEEGETIPHLTKRFGMGADRISNVLFEEGVALRPSRSSKYWGEVTVEVCQCEGADRDYLQNPIDHECPNAKTVIRTAW